MAFDGRGASNGTAPLTKHGGPRGFSALDVVVQGGFLPLGSGPVEFGNWLLGPSLAIATNLTATVTGIVNGIITPYVTAAASSATGAAASAAAAAASLAGFNAGTWAPIASPTFTGAVNVSQALKLSGSLFPAQLTASVNNYNPAGLSTATVIRLDANAAWDITGLAGGADGRFMLLENGSAFPIRLTNADAASLAANRFQFGVPRILEAGRTILIIYDGGSTCWRDVESLTKATGADIQGATDDQRFATAKALSDSAAWVPSVGGELAAGTLTLDMTKGYNRSHAQTANVAVAKPSAGLVDGQSYSILFLQDGTGGRTITPSAFFVPGSIAFAFITTANAYNVLNGQYHAGKDKLINCSVWKSA